jgi:hypothetical protein
MMMRYSYLKYFGIPVTTILAFTVCLSLIFEPFEPLVGDLTRIGNYAEKDFGWQAPNAFMRLEENGPHMRDPDVLVLGDSFSRSNVWQSFASQKLSAKIQSFEYADVGCIQNWVDYALNQPSAKTIIIETVERVFAPRFQDVAPCAASQPIAFPISASLSSPTRPSWPPEWHISRTYKVAYNTLQMMHKPNGTLRGNVINAPIDTHCAKFSNRRSDRLLYYAQDEEKFQWKPSMQASAIANILRIQKLFQDHGKNFVFVVAPDKLSTYQNCLKGDAILSANENSKVITTLIAAGIHTPDLLTVFRQNANKVDDLYKPNDTHLSQAGYALMANQLVQFLNQK